MKLLSILCWVLFAFAALSAYAGNSLKPFKITFQTTDCSGQTGLASVDVDHIDKIQTMDCKAPAGHALKQVLVKSGLGLSSYNAYTVTDKESMRIQRQIDSYMQAREKALEQGRTIIIEH